MKEQKPNQVGFERVCKVKSIYNRVHLIISLVDWSSLRSDNLVYGPFFNSTSGPTTKYAGLGHMLVRNSSAYTQFRPRRSHSIEPQSAVESLCCK